VAKATRATTADREPEADCHRALAGLHQLAGHVVDGGNVVGVDGVAQAEAVGDQGGAEQDWLLMELPKGPNPGGGVHRDQYSVNANGAPAHAR